MITLSSFSGLRLPDLEMAAQLKDRGASGKLLGAEIWFGAEAGEWGILLKFCASGRWQFEHFGELEINDAETA